MNEFSFPFPPYGIQLQLMNEIKECIDKQQVGIFESPTGTGKTLSVLCATATWLEEFEKQMEEELLRKSRLVEEVAHRFAITQMQENRQFNGHFGLATLSDNGRHDFLLHKFQLAALGKTPSAWCSSSWIFSKIALRLG
ncbi:unnamed protein product [Heligmosomoides polygyrus]|uniref:Helicase ATP-binding domain-containing protein n=1 Tax=Heligmosomoides polygyrus TaxID=6339 RepID=A0A183GQ63_HELPZ|nr:unnamed protein product [Heligmosomoides polygyrus]